MVSEISKQHCSVTRKHGRVTVTDTSSNGTFVNGKLLGRGVTMVLSHEDILSLLVPSADCEAFNPEQVKRVSPFLLRRLTECARSRSCIASTT